MKTRQHRFSVKEAKAWFDLIDHLEEKHGVYMSESGFDELMPLMVAISRAALKARRTPLPHPLPALRGEGEEMRGAEGAQNIEPQITQRTQKGKR
jgi:hypothetical protein